MKESRISRGIRRDILTVAFGSAGAQVLAFLVAPLLTRLFTPGQFGIFAAYYAISQLIFPVASLRYSLAIVLPSTHRDGDAVLQISLGLSIASGLFLELLFVIGLLARLPFLGAGTTARTIANFLAISIALNSTYQCFAYWAVRREHYGLVSHSRIASTVGMLVFQTLAGMAGAGPPGLIAGDVFGLVVANAYMISVARRRPADGRSFYNPVGLATIRSLIHEHRRFPLYNTWGTLIDGASVSLPPLLLLRYFGPAVAGLYALSFRVVYAPMSVLGQATSMVLFQRISKRWTVGEDVRALLSRAAVELSIVGGVIAIGAIAMGPSTFALVFGRRWREAGQYARILAPSLVLVLVASNVSSFLLVRQQQARLLAVQLLLLTATVVPLVVGGIVIHDTITTFAIFSMVQALAYGTYITVVLRSGRVSPRDLWGAFVELPAFRHARSKLSGR